MGPCAVAHTDRACDRLRRFQSGKPDRNGTHGVRPDDFLDDSIPGCVRHAQDVGLSRDRFKVEMAAVRNGYLPEVRTFL
jgi:hypothetical protein